MNMNYYEYVLFLDVIVHIYAEKPNKFKFNIISTTHALLVNFIILQHLIICYSALLNMWGHASGTI